MRPRLSLARWSANIFLVGTLLFTQHLSFAIDRKIFGEYAECLTGNCDNGTGTISTGEQKWTGNWRNGRFRDDEYLVEHSFAPGKVTSRTYNSDGYPLKGTSLRIDGSLFTGTFKTSDNPFTRGKSSSPHQGRYQAANGVIYDGMFEYVPVFRKIIHLPGDLIRKDEPPSEDAGILLFTGVRITPDEDEVLQGIFATDVSYLWGPFKFFRARPNFFAQVRQNYVEEQVQVSADMARERERERQESAAFWSGLFQLTMGVISEVGKAQMNANSQRIAMMSLGEATNGRKTPKQAFDSLIAQLPSQAGGYQVPKDGKAASYAPVKMTQSQYQELIRENQRNVSVQQGNLQNGQKEGPARSVQSTQNPNSVRMIGDAGMAEEREKAAQQSKSQTPTSPSPPKIGAAQTPKDIEKVAVSSAKQSPSFEFKTIAGSGQADTCMAAKETALKLAHVSTENGGHRDCFALGDGWSFDKVTFAGREQAFACSNGTEFKAAVTDAVISCKKRTQ